MSLRMRLIVSFALIVIICLSIVFVSVSAMLQDYRDSFVNERLDNITRPVYSQIRSLALGQTSLNEVWVNLQEQAQKNDVYILLVDDEGKITRQVSPQQTLVKQPMEIEPAELPHLSG